MYRTEQAWTSICCTNFIQCKLKAFMFLHGYYLNVYIKYTAGTQTMQWYKHHHWSTIFEPMSIGKMKVYAIRDHTIWIKGHAHVEILTCIGI